MNMQRVYGFLLILIFGLSSGRVLGECDQSLEWAIEETFRTNPNALRSESEIRQARATLLQAFGGFLPSLDMSTLAGWEKINPPGIQPTTNYKVTDSGITLIQPLFTGFRTFHLVKQQNSLLDASKFREAFTKETLAAQVASVYLTTLLNQKEKELAIENVKAHEETLRKIRNRYEGGAGDRTEVDLAMARLDEAKVSLLGIERSLEQTKAAFGRIVGYLPGELWIPSIPLLPESLTAARNLAFCHNPTLLAANAELQASIENIGIAKSRFYPEVSFEYSANSQSNLGGVRGRERTRRGLFVASYNLFRGFQDYAEVRQAEEISMQTAHTRNEVRREVVQTLTSTWEAIDKSLKQAEELKAREEATKALLEGYIKQFTLGRRSLLNVLDIQRELFNTRISKLQAEFSAFIDTYSLYATIGLLRQELALSSS